MANVNPTVLLVEDDPDDQEIFRRVLQKSNITTNLQIVSDGRAAIDYLDHVDWEGRDERARKPDLILLDLNMPGLNGFEVLAKIRDEKRTRIVPVVVFTTSDSGVDIARSYELGANSYITKPVDFESFKSVVQDLNEYWFDTVALPQVH